MKSFQPANLPNVDYLFALRVKTHLKLRHVDLKLNKIKLNL